MNRTAQNRDITEWWARYGPELVNFANTRLAGISRAGADEEDVVQEAITGLIAHPVEGEIRNPRGLLYKAVFFRCAELLASNRATKFTPVDPQSYRIISATKPDDADHEAAVLIHNAIAQLTDEERVVAIRRLMGGDHLMEVAELLGLSRHHVTKLAAQTADKLRISLEQLDPGDQLPPDELAARRWKLLQEMAAATSIPRACRAFGVSVSAFQMWKRQEREAS